ncbi:MAG: phytanoyl-CoA dioxygenase family protein [Armatimonadetes bacterium]|nr:phytanoyl-CoA dioxygenase family protein [Armatimonadota bacterium]
MDRAALSHQVNDEERRAFERDGYFLIPNALTPEQVSHFVGVTDDVDRQYRREHGLKSHDRVNLHDTIGHDERFLELIDWPTTFPKVWGLMGWNLQLYHTQMIVTPPGEAAPEKKRLGWHQDNNRMNRDLEVELQPMISMKVVYFLNDIPEAGMGNFYIVPGSHTSRRLIPSEDGDPNPAGALAVTVRAGDALVFDRRLWHAASPNSSNVTRKALFYGYSHRWLRPKCFMDVSKVWDRLDPIRRQLLGACTSFNGYFDPKEDDVPLRAWIRENAGQEAVAA